MGLNPRVLVAPDDHAFPVRVEEQHGRVSGRLLEQIMLDREVEVGVKTARDVDLRLLRRIGDGAHEIGISTRSLRDDGNGAGPRSQ